MRYKTISQISLERASIFHIGPKTGKLKYCIPAVASENERGVCGKPLLKLLHFDRCFFSGKVVPVPCGQRHFYSTLIFVPRTKIACTSIWEQCMIQHCHLTVCHHIRANAWCMLEIPAQEGFMYQEKSRHNPNASC